MEGKERVTNLNRIRQLRDSSLSALGESKGYNRTGSTEGIELSLEVNSMMAIDVIESFKSCFT